MGDFKNFVNSARGRGLPRYSFVERPFVKRFALCYRTVVCLSVCPVCNVGVLWQNGWMNQDETWYGDTPWPWPHSFGWGCSSPSTKGEQPPPIFGLLWPNGWMDQYAIWYGGRPRPRPHCVRREPSCPKKVHPNFRPMYIVQMDAELNYC